MILYNSFKISIQGGIYTNNITNVFEQCYIPLMPIHACMQQVHLIAIKYLTLLMVNQLKLENHQQPIPHLTKHQNHVHTTKSQE